MEDATGAGRGYGVAGGVASAIEACIREYYPDVEVNIEHAESLSECKKILMLAKAGKKNGCLIEGSIENCVIGRGTVIKKGAVVKNSVILPGVVIGADAHVENVVVDKNAKIIHAKKVVSEGEPGYIKRNDIL